MLVKVLSLGMLACLAVVGFALANSALAGVVPPGTEAEIRERTQPVGQVCRAGASCGGSESAATETAVAAAMSGEQVYSTFCFACHTTGVSGAPLLGDAAAWEPRLAKGMDVLMANTVNGINVMPAKGTCMACSDAELQAAVDYMLDASR
jgi:cytochrome c5